MKIVFHPTAKLLRLLPFLILVGSGGWASAQGIAEVWPGDANANGTVSHVDLLYVGRWFGETGPARDSVSINWTLHTVPKWAANASSVPDPSHADCNGDSTVDILDIAAIDANYGLQNGANLPDLSSIGLSGGNAAPLGISLVSGPLSAGSTDTLWINLGSASSPVDSLLGFATTLTFDSNLVDTAYAFFDGSWLGDPNQDLLAIDRYRPGELDLAATRTDRVDARNGAGYLGGVVVVMTENLKRDLEFTELEFSFSQALALSSGLQAAPISLSSTSTGIWSASTPFEVLVYPIPATESVQVIALESASAEISGRLLDSQGRICQEFRFANEIELQRNGLRNGIYLLELQDGEAVQRKRIVFIE